MRLMARNSQQTARVIQSLVMATHRRLGTWGTIALVVLGVGYLFAEPMLEAQLGVDLPGMHTPGDATAVADRPDNTESPSPSAKPSNTKPPTSSKSSGESSSRPPALDDVLEQIGRDTYRSEAGLIYGRGSVHGNRLEHLKSHATDDPDREGSHGVFDEQNEARLVQLVDEVYLKGLEGGRDVDHQREEGRDVYTVDMHRRVGTIGGEWGARHNHPVAKHVRLVVDGEKFITAFPLKP